MSPAPSISRKSNHLWAHTDTRGVRNQAGNLSRETMGTTNKDRNVHSKRSDSHPKEYHTLPTLTIDRYNNQIVILINTFDWPLNNTSNDRSRPDAANNDKYKFVGGKNQNKVGKFKYKKKPCKLSLEFLMNCLSMLSKVLTAVVKPFSPMSALFCVRATKNATNWMNASSRVYIIRESQNESCRIKLSWNETFAILTSWAKIQRRRHTGC